MPIEPFEIQDSIEDRKMQWCPAAHVREHNQSENLAISEFGQFADGQVGCGPASGRLP
jgi:hypothetical protein